MTTYQSNFNRYTAFKAQSAVGSPASGSGGFILRQNGGTPGKLTKDAIASNEVRRDGQPVKGRHGFQKTSGGPYTCEFSPGSFDAILPALMCGAWDSEITKTQADFTSLTITDAHTITFGAGSPITMGFRANDVVDLLNLADTGNNSHNIRIASVSSTAITTVDALTPNATPDTSCSLIRRGRKVINPATRTLTYFTAEDHFADLDASDVMPDVFFKSAKFTMQPNGLLMFEPSWIGTGQFSNVEGSSAPVLTSPSLATAIPYAALDATLRFGSSDVADLVSFDLTIDNGAVADAVAGAKASPTVLPGKFTANMNLSFLMKDIQAIKDYLAETAFSLQVLAAANMTEPKDFIAINVPNFSLGGADPSAISTAGGSAKITIPVPAALIGHDTRGTGYDDTTVSFQISNAS